MRSGQRAAAHRDQDLQRALRLSGAVLTGLGVPDHAIGPVETAVFRTVDSRGKEPSGLGYVCGHTGGAAGITVAAVPALRTAARIAPAIAVPVVGLSRMCIGAHLPLDVLGGASRGVAVDAAVSRLVPDHEGRGA